MEVFLGGLGSLSACLLPADCHDLPIFCQACCPPRWSGRLLSFLILQRQCPGAQPQWSALLPPNQDQAGPHIHQPL